MRWRSRDAICRALARRWEAEGIALGREDEANVRRAFGALGVGPSGDVVRLYGSVGGMIDGDMDSVLY